MSIYHYIAQIAYKSANPLATLLEHFLLVEVCMNICSSRVKALTNVIQEWMLESCKFAQTTSDTQEPLDLWLVGYRYDFVCGSKSLLLVTVLGYSPNLNRAIK